jgi:hypothetical protein
VKHDAQVVEMVRDSEAWSKIVFVGIHQAAGEAVLPSDKNPGSSVLKDEVGVGVSDVVQGARVLIAQAHFDGGIARNLKTVLHKGIGGPSAKLHLRYAGLALLEIA